MKQLYKIINLIIDGIVLFICIFIGAVYLMQFAGIHTYIVRSGSMEPAIQTGSLCFIQTKYDYDDIVVGDVIAYELGNRLVTHRVVQTTSEGMITKGDNNDIRDGLTTSKENYIGKNMFSFPYLGYVLSWMQSQKGKMILISFIGAMGVLHLVLPEIKKK